MATREQLGDIEYLLSQLGTVLMYWQKVDEELGFLFREMMKPASIAASTAI
jgi:hypothetical protein